MQQIAKYLWRQKHVVTNGEELAYMRSLADLIATGEPGCQNVTSVLPKVDTLRKYGYWARFSLVNNTLPLLSPRVEFSVIVDKLLAQIEDAQGNEVLLNSQVMTSIKKSSLSLLLYEQRPIEFSTQMPNMIASHACLAHMIAHVRGGNVRAHELIVNLGNYFVYTRHMDALGEQLTRAPTSTFPRVKFARAINSIGAFRAQDFALV